MLQSPKNGKKENKKRQLKRNTSNNNVLQTSLITRIFATNFDVGCLHASYEMHFVKKIQLLFSFHSVYHQTYRCCFTVAFMSRKIILK